MARIRKSAWHAFLGILSLAVLLQAQVAGCCKMGSWVLASDVPATAAGNRISGTADEATPNLHACCPRPDAPDRTGEKAAPEASAGIGHCLVGADLNVAALASAHSPGSHADLPIPSIRRPAPHHAGFRAPAGAYPRPESPVLRANLPLLI